MAFDPERVTTLTFDSYSTLVDVDAVEHALAKHVPDPEPVATMWRARSLEYTFVANRIDAYQPFYGMLRDALAAALAAHASTSPTNSGSDSTATTHDTRVARTRGFSRARADSPSCASSRSRWRCVPISKPSSMVS